MHQTENGAILGRDLIQIVHGANAAGAGHVLDDDVGLAGNVACKERREGARVAGIAATGVRAQDPRDLPALVEIVSRARRGREENRERHGADGSGARHRR
jgi:hypothetical protein